MDTWKQEWGAIKGTKYYTASQTERLYVVVYQEERRETVKGRKQIMLGGTKREEICSKKISQSGFQMKI